MVDDHTRETISHSGRKKYHTLEKEYHPVNQWDTLCTYHYLNKATTTILSTSNIFINNNKKKNVNNKYIDK
jgi:hypothetical protein